MQARRCIESLEKSFPITRLHRRIKAAPSLQREIFTGCESTTVRSFCYCGTHEGYIFNISKKYDKYNFLRKACKAFFLCRFDTGAYSPHIRGMNHHVRPITTLSLLIAFTLSFSITATPAETSREITFVAYNLENYLKMDRRINGEKKENAPKPDDEIVHLIRIIKDTAPDVLGVCEIGDEEDVADFTARLKNAGLDLPHQETVKAADDTRRLALFSKFPIVATDPQKDLSYQIDGKELRFQRGILDATLQVTPDYQLRLLGLHLKSKRPIEEADQSVMRLNEASLLRAHIDKILAANPKVNLLAYGDFNETKNEQPIRVIRGKFGTPNFMGDIYLKDKDGYRWTYKWSYADQYSRFDFVFVSPGMYPEILQEKSRIHSDKYWDSASDHRPLVIRIDPVEREK